MQDFLKKSSPSPKIADFLTDLRGVSIIISNMNIQISRVSIIIHGSAPLRKQEILGMPTMY